MSTNRAHDPAPWPAAATVPEVLQAARFLCRQGLYLQKETASPLPRDLVQGRCQDVVHWVRGPQASSCVLLLVAVSGGPRRDRLCSDAESSGREAAVCPVPTLPRA